MSPISQEGRTQDELGDHAREGQQESRGDNRPECGQQDDTGNRQWVNRSF